MILDYIQAEIALKGYPPSIREIGKAVGLQSTAAVANQLKQLEERGVIRRDPAKPRAIEIMARKTRGSAKEVSRHKFRFVDGVEKLDAAADTPPPTISVNGDRLVRVDGRRYPGLGAKRGDYLLVAPAAGVKKGDLVLFRANGCGCRFGEVTDTGDGHIFVDTRAGAEKPVKAPLENLVGKISAVVRLFEQPPEPSENHV